jgi:hypothetical protein
MSSRSLPSSREYRRREHLPGAAGRAHHLRGPPRPALAGRHIRLLRPWAEQGGESPARGPGGCHRQPEVQRDAAEARLSLHPPIERDSRVHPSATTSVPDVPVHAQEHQPRARMRGWVLGGAVALAAVRAIVASSGRLGPDPQPLTEQDRIVVADFDNRTGDPAFDHTPKQALILDLERSRLARVVTERAHRRPDGAPSPIAFSNPSSARTPSSRRENGQAPNP